MNQVLAHCYVIFVGKRAYNREAREIELGASANETNRAWATATPVFNTKMTVMNGAAAAFFEEAYDAGEDIEVTFRRIPKAKDVAQG